MNAVQEFLTHPQLLVRHRWREIASPVGPLSALIPPVDTDGVEPLMGAVPGVGQHTEAILQELGLDRATIAGLRQAGVI